VAQTYSSQEKRAVENLLRQGFDAFCPLEGRASKTSPLLSVEVPLFPCYVFVGLALDQPWQSINSTYGVIRLLTDRHRVSPRPLFVRGAEVIRAVSRLRESVNDPFPPGTIVRVRHGPFTSFLGTVQSMDKHMRIKVLLSIFDRDTRVEFDDPTALEVVVEE
jgi:transcription antitermination factor NusG